MRIMVAAKSLEPETIDNKSTVQAKRLSPAKELKEWKRIRR